MPEKKLTIDVEVKKRVTSQGKNVNDNKSEVENQKQTDKEKLESLKASLKQKQSLLDADIKRQQVLRDHAKKMENDAERHGNREKLKEMIAFRKMMESQLRVMEADMRLLRSKDLSEFKSNLKEKDKAQKEYDRSLRNAPKTNFKGAIGSESYVSQLVSSQKRMLPGSDEYVQTGVLIERYKTQLKSAGVEIQTLSGKIQTGLKGALNDASKSFITGGLAAAGAAVSINALWQAMQKGVELLELKANFEGTAVQLNNLREATNRTVTEAGLIKLSNQAQDLGISLEDQVVLFALSERAGDKYGTSIEENMRKAINVTEGMTKGVKELGIQKAEYEKILTGLVKTAGGEIEFLQAEGQERELTIKKLDPEIQKRLRLQALIQASGITYEQALNQQSSWNDTLQESIVSLQDLWTYAGIALTAIVNFATPIGPLAKTIRDLNKEIAELPGEIENFDRAILSLVNDIPLIGSSLKGVLEDMGQFIGILDQASDAMRNLQNSQMISMDNIVEGWKGTYEQGVNQLMLLKQISREEAETILKPYVHFAKENDAENSNKTTKTNKGSKSPSVKEKEEELNLVKLQEQELKKLQLQLEKNKGDVGAELELKRKILDVEREIHRLKFGEPNTAIDYKVNTKAEQGSGITQRENNYGRDAGIDQAQRIKEINDQIASKQVDAFGQSLSIAQQIDQALGGGASDVIQGFQTAWSITQSIVELLNTLNDVSSLFSLIPGVGGAIGAIARAEGGDVEKGKLYEWNENGKELFIPTVNGYVLDAKKFNEFSGSVVALALASQARNNEAVNMFNGKSGSQNIIVKNYIKNPIDFKQAFKVTQTEVDLADNTSNS